VALAVGHLLIAAAAMAMVVVMLYAGTRPNAELEGILVLWPIHSTGVATVLVGPRA